MIAVSMKMTKAVRAASLRMATAGRGRAAVSGAAAVARIGSDLLDIRPAE
jgi:hypothetical protein